MKKLSFRRCAAAIAACAVMASAMPVVPAYTSAAENLITNSTFENGAFDWGIYKESGGAGTITTEDGKLALNITNQGKLNYAVQLFYDILPLYKNGVYRLKFDISASIDRYVEAMIQQNGGTYQSYVWKGLEVTKEPKSYDIEFTMEYPTDIMSKLCFNCGIQEVDGELPPHTIYLDNVSLELIDDSNVDYAADLPYEADIIANQVGYRPSAKKTAVFRTDKGGEFSVVDAATGKSVYTGKMEGPVDYDLAGESDFTGDFSSVTAPGKYYITSDGLDDSYSFEIGENVYRNLLDDSVRMLYLQRCGCEIVDDKFSHPACHDTLATIYKTTEKIDVSGGWHDAGDYGRYVVAAAKAVADLLYAYQNDPVMFYSNNNGIPDILTEVRYELEWMLKMQDQADGGVYHKVTCENFPGYVMPEDETKPLIVMPKSTTATADFAASMAMAYEFYKDIDTAFADKCLDAAEKAYAWAKANPNVLYSNPADVVTGEYGDKITSDELYWASAQLCRATGDESYMDGVSLKTGLDWSTVGDYGNIAILTTERIDKSSEIYKNAAAAVKEQADDMLAIANSSPYGVALDEFNWGSNMTVANAGIIMALTYQLTGDTSYLDGANKQLDYLLGMNPNGYSFVTGYGTAAPENPHHRPSMAVGEAMKGMLVGGVNQNLEDSAAKAYCKRNPAAKCWVDNAESYSTNEITIYWNSPLTYLLSMTKNEAGTPSVPSDGKKWGDANCDGNVTIADAAAVLQYLGNSEKYPLTEEGKLLADVYEQGDGLTTRDSISIQKFVLGKIPSLPESVMQGAQTTAPPATTTTKNTQAPATTVTTVATTTKPSNGITDYGTPMNEKATAVEDFRDGSSKLFFASDGWENGDPFDCFWYEQNTSLKNGMLSLTIDKDRSGKYNYSGAEYRTFDSYGYGYYETSMQAIKNNGVVSSFFTYTGPSEDNPWDEIDIEILGKDTTKVQLNYYTNGVGNHEYMYDLGFDSSEGFHTYGFDWQPDHITWYVDGKPVHTAYDNIPVTPGRIMMNTWPGRGVDEWLNHYDGKTPLTAHYQWVTYNKQ